MSFVGNLLWFVIGGGIISGTVWFLTGILWCCTIVGIPIGIACFRIARFAYLPFGKVLVLAEWTGEERIVGTGLMNFIWCVFFGVWMAISCICAGVVYCCTIIGIPWGLAYFKLGNVCFAPLGKRVVSTAMAKELEARYVSKKADEMLNK